MLQVPRETPLNLAHLQHGGGDRDGQIVLPVPATFYAAPKTLDGLVAHTVARVLDLFGVHSAKLARWQGMKGIPEERS